VMEASSYLGKELMDTSEYPPAVLSNSIELLVTNLDQRAEQYEIKKIIGNLFREHVNVFNISVYIQSDGNVAAIVKVGSKGEAQLAISQLHKRKVGQKRISISYNNANNGGSYTLSKEVIALLKSVPNGKTHLFKFREMFEKRYHMSVAVSDLYKMKDIINITEDSSGRMIELKPGNFGVQESESVESLYCPIHCPVEEQKGWAEGIVQPPLPNVNMSLKELGPKLELIVKNHNGSIPLASLVSCYEAEFGKLRTDSGVPLEHLVSCIKGLVITTGVTGIKRIMESSCEVSSSVPPFPPPDGRCRSPQLVTQMLRFSREVVDLLKTYPGCKMNLSKFIPDYHHHFMRQCRVAEYGYTRLIDLLEALPNVVQILGDGNRTYLTLAHRAQVKRFTSDLLKVLKSQTSKQLHLSELKAAFEQFFNTPFRITDYGVCDAEDLLMDISEHTIVVSPRQGLKEDEIKVGQSEEVTQDLLISIPKREQTDDEREQTVRFGQDIVELLGHSPDCLLPFNKFIPSYHHHFGRQCRVGDYGFSKLIEIFEALPEIVDIIADVDGERIIQLVQQEKLKVLGKQIVDVIQNNKKKYIPVSQLQEAYTNKFGFQLRLENVGFNTIEELLDHLQSWIKINEGRDEPFVTIVDQGYIRTMAKNVRKLIMDQPDGKMELKHFVSEFGNQFDSNIDIEMMRRDMSDIVTIKHSKNEEYVQLTPLQMVARNIRDLLKEEKCKFTVEQLESAYFHKYGTSLKAEDYGFNRTTSLLAAIPDIVDVRGRGSRKLVSLHTNRLLESKHPFQKFKRITQASPTINARTSHVRSSQSATVSFSGRGFDMIRSRVPPKTSSNGEEHSFQNASSDRNNNLSGSVLRSQHVPYVLSNTPVPFQGIIKASSANEVDFSQPASYVGNNNFSASASYQPQNFSPCSQVSIPFASPNLYRHASPHTGIYYPYQNRQASPPTGFPYPYHGNSVWGSPVDGSPIAGPTFQQHMMRLSPSPIITQAPYYIQPTSVIGQGTPMLPNVPGSPPCLLVSKLEPQVAGGNQVQSSLSCEAEIDRNLEKLTESIANQVLMGTSPRPVTPTSPVYFPRSATPTGSFSPASVYLPRSGTPTAAHSVPSVPRSVTPNLHQPF